MGARRLGRYVRASPIAPRRSMYHGPPRRLAGLV